MWRDRGGRCPSLHPWNGAETREPDTSRAAEEAETGFGGKLRGQMSIAPSERKLLWDEALQTEGDRVREGLRGGAGTEPLCPKVS